MRGRGETGRRTGLKIPRPQGRAGSIPAVRTILTLSAALLGLAACERRPDDVAVVASVIGDTPDLRDPSRAPLSPAARVLLAATAQGLVAFDAAGGIEPALAERWIVTDDGRSFIFRLRSDATWADGTRVTSEQVAAVLRRAIAAGSRNPLLPYLSAIDEIVAMTPTVIEVRLSKPRPDLLKLFAQPELSITQRGRGGSGPLRLVRSAPRGALRLRPGNDEATDVEPPPAEDYVVLRGERAAKAVARFAARTSDLVSGGTIADWPLVAAADVAPINVRVDPAAGLFGLSVVLRTGFLSTPDNRAAVALALDRAAFTDRVRTGWPPAEVILPGTLESAAPPAVPAWVAIPANERQIAARARVAAWGAPVQLRIALPDGPGGNLLWSWIGGALRAVGIAVTRVGPRAPADLRLVDEVAPYDSARWYLRRACQPCAADTAALIAAARDAPDLAQRGQRLAAADAALAADTAFIPIARPFRWSLVAQRLRAWTPNARAWHPLNRLRRSPN